MVKCPYTDKYCNKIKQYSPGGGCDWGQMDINNESGDYGTCRLTGECLIEEEEEG